MNPTLTRNKTNATVELKIDDYTLPITMEGKMPVQVERQLIQVEFSRNDTRNTFKQKLKEPIFIGKLGPLLDIARGPDGRLFFRLYENERKYRQYGGPHMWVGSVHIIGGTISTWEDGLGYDDRKIYEKI